MSTDEELDALLERVEQVFPDAVDEVCAIVYTFPNLVSVRFVKENFANGCGDGESLHIRAQIEPRVENICGKFCSAEVNMFLSKTYPGTPAFLECSKIRGLKNKTEIKFIKALQVYCFN